MPTLKVGEKQEYVAVLRSRADTTISPVWTSSDDSIALIDQRGIVSAVAPGSVTITARYRNQQATSLVAIVTDLSGIWTGQFLLKTCSQTSGPPPSPCRFLVDGNYPFQLTLSQTHGGAEGRLSMFSGGTLSGGLHAAVGIGPTLSISEQDLIGSDTNAHVMVWQNSVDESSRVIAGTFSIRTSNESIFGAQVLVFGCEFHAARD